MINSIKVENVVKSYNGKVGCMCGCQGKYSLPSIDVVAANNKECGWDAYDESNVSVRSIKIAVNKINKVIAMPEEIRKELNWNVEADDNGSWVAIDDGSRTTVVYL